MRCKECQNSEILRQFWCSPLEAVGETSEMNLDAHQSMLIIDILSLGLFFFFNFIFILMIQEEIAKDLLSGDDEETQSSADDLTPSVTSHEATDFFPRPLRCRRTNFITILKTVQALYTAY